MTVWLRIPSEDSEHRYWHRIEDVDSVHENPDGSVELFWISTRGDDTVYLEGHKAREVLDQMQWLQPGKAKRPSFS